MSVLEQNSNHHGLYGALNTRLLEIRLVHLNASTDPSSKIYCQLEVYSILNGMEEPQSSRTFEALSYTWGDPSIVVEIYVNNRSFSITSNLEAFLRQRREPDRNVTLWIDAVCINQSDPQDKNQQIPMMSMIYVTASNLIIWLGPASADSHLAMNELRRLGSGSPYDKMPLVGRTLVQQIQHLLRRPWWTRVWIVQELAHGGLGIKINRMSVHCGPDSLLWTNLVIAAARMKAYEDDQKEVFPVISTILELDSLRESARHYLKSPTTLSTSFDFICRFRNFLASNPRDKIYGIYNIFSTSPTEKLQPKYEAEATDIYMDFAIDAISSEVGLETLRHCGAATLAVPSWVPDWSTPLTCQPLPIRQIPRYFDVPWWAEPQRPDSDGDYNQEDKQNISPPRYAISRYSMDPLVMERERRSRLNRLRVGAKGSGQVYSLKEIPSGFTFHQVASEIKSNLENMLQNKNLVLFVQDDRCTELETGSKDNYKPAHPLRQGEIISERRTKSWLLQELDHLSCTLPTSSTDPNQTKASINREAKTLTLDGIPWDTVETCHTEFVNDVRQDWWNATRFMVAVGCCKMLAMNSNSARKHHSSVEELLESFWLTLFAGKTTGPQTSVDTNDRTKRLRYTEWLPCIPQSWTVTSPRTTISNTGHIVAVEVNKMVHKIFEGSGSISKSASNYVITSPSGFSSLIPEDWTDSDKRQQEADARYLGSLWHQQPYDLYHGPFDLPHIVPDPYWEVRSREDELAKRLMRESDFPFILGGRPSDERHMHIYDATVAEAKKYWKGTPSIVPQGTLDPCIEQFALGRKFFITKKGYFGIGPQDTKPGDRIMSIFGSVVPFVLRKGTSQNLPRGWKLIGETYVHGIMNGEIISQWKLGLVESGKIVLV